jgi:hypothetical protein
MAVVQMTLPGIVMVVEMLLDARAAAGVLLEEIEEIRIAEGECDVQSSSFSRSSGV